MCPDFSYKYSTSPLTGLIATLELSAPVVTTAALLNVAPEFLLYCTYKSEPVLLPLMTLPQLSAANERVVLSADADTVTD